MAKLRIIGLTHIYLYVSKNHISVNQVQKTLMVMYKDIKKVLDSHDIIFYIQYGTAIGALRHDGLIPWDDDIDILIWEKDMDEVKHVLSTELDSDMYYFHDSSADNHPHVIWKGEDFEADLRAKKAPFIDLFPIDPYPSTRGRQLLANAAIWGNVGTIWAIDHINSLWIHRMLYWIPGIFKKIEHGMVNKDSDLTVVFCTSFAHSIFRKSCYGTPRMHVFGDAEAPLPEHIHEMLTHIYGDYMTPPPEDKRTGAGGYPCSVVKDYIMNGKP